MDQEQLVLSPVSDPAQVARTTVLTRGVLLVPVKTRSIVAFPFFLSAIKKARSRVVASCDAYCFSAFHRGFH